MEPTLLPKPQLPMTPERLAEIRQRAEQSSVMLIYNDSDGFLQTDDGEDIAQLFDNAINEAGEEMCELNGPFFAHARPDVLDLLAELQRREQQLEATLEQWEEATLENIDEHGGDNSICAQFFQLKRHELGLRLPPMPAAAGATGAAGEAGGEVGCQCAFVMIMRGTDDQPYCAQCRLLVDE